MQKINNLIGERFGRLSVISITDKRASNGCVKWLCKCDCGQTKEIPSSALLSGNSNSCGCLRRELQASRQPSNFKDISGQRFGQLTVIKYWGRNCKNRKSMWECQCDCGTIKVISGNELRRGSTTSCGCLIREMQSQRAKNNLESIGKEMNKRRNEKHCREKTVIYNLTEKRASHNTSGYKGVSFNKRKNLYEAYITLKRNRRHLGYFSTVGEAAKARAKAEEELFDPILEKYGIPKTSA